MMHSREEFWSRVDACLDERKDPRREREIQAWLSQHPEERDQLARLCARLELLAPPRSRLPWPWWIAASVLLAGAALHWMGRAEPQGSQILSLQVEHGVELSAPRQDPHIQVIERRTQRLSSDAFAQVEVIHERSTFR
jgi:hypothetical protein